MKIPVDAAVRSEALNPNESYIVQAPAGSGKTELLTRRILTLLTRVNEPEEILAITFTRKAASEMRQRVIEILSKAKSGEEPDNAYEAEGLALAQQVLQRDEQFQWELIRNSQRLNLRTIDSLATQLAHRLPITSALGAPTGIVDNAENLYYEIAGRFIENNLPQLERILLHLGNRLELAQRLLANLLAKRDQWKRHVFAVSADHDELRSVLELMLAELVESRLQRLCELVPNSLQDDLLPILGKAAEFVLIDNEGDIDSLNHEIQIWHQLEALPGARVDDMANWDAIAFALLTSTSDVRKRLTVKEGFPAKSAAKKLGVNAKELEAHKAHMLKILERVALFPEFIEALSEVRRLPYPRYSDEQWMLLSDLITILPDLLVELHLGFSQRGLVDFVEISERARMALGPDDNPTDLALSLDLSLQHILVDEFQDTSQTQFRLFEQLVRGWYDGDGRTFFVVGDPMQSIYRFRDGDVALFNQVVTEGIGQIRLNPLVLSVNFRSAPAVIDWVNTCFDDVFPKFVDINSGAVPYSQSISHLDAEGSVSLHPVIDSDKEDEARIVVDIAERAISSSSEHQVAILVRTRGQAAEIFNSLRSRQLAYQSIDMDLIGERMVVKDLVSLCLSLRYPHDRLHWLSLLRAPFVGLVLDDLHAIMQGTERSDTVIGQLSNPAVLSSLSEDGQYRVKRFLKIIVPALARVARGQIMPWVESCWLQLGGPIACKNPVDTSAAESAITRLYELESQGQLWRKKELKNAMDALFAPINQDARCQIQVMTLHKAKGLEFDTVILPALDRQPRGDSTQLLNWFESTLDNQAQLLMAPFEQSGLAPHQRDGINRLVRKAQERCDEQEKLRLLYVACTRAKRHLHLVTRVKRNNVGDFRAPNNQSLLKPLWSIMGPLIQFAEKNKESSGSSSANLRSHGADADLPEVVDNKIALGLSLLNIVLPEEGGTIEDSALLEDSLGTDTTKLTQQVYQGSLFEDDDRPGGQPDTNAEEVPVPGFERLVSDVEPPVFKPFQWGAPQSTTEGAPPPVEFAWAGAEARQIGTVIHEQLAAIAGDINAYQALETPDVKAVIVRQLLNQGMNAHRVSDACESVMVAVKNTLDDSRGRWTLMPHAQAKSEWAITVPRQLPHVDSQLAIEAGGDLDTFQGILNVVIDRTFVDEKGTRWIVDFKTGNHTGGQKEAFLDNEQTRYQDQLNGYAAIMRAMEDRPIRVGLYFPMLKGWREWEPQ